jgi:hypothetical protein
MPDLESEEPGDEPVAITEAEAAPPAIETPANDAPAPQPPAPSDTVEPSAT